MEVVAVLVDRWARVPSHGLYYEQGRRKACVYGERPASAFATASKLLSRIRSSCFMFSCRATRARQRRRVAWIPTARSHVGGAAHAPPFPAVLLLVRHCSIIIVNTII